MAKKKQSSEEEGFELDFDKILSKLKDYKKYAVIIGLIIILSATWYVRTQCVPNYQGRNFIELDSYYFFRNAKTLVETGTLPANDTLRYYPTGFDTSRELLMPSYAVAAIYPMLNLIAGMTIAETAILYPVIVTCISMIFFYFLAKDMFGNKVAFIASLLLGVTNGYIFRTSAGFVDKESIAMLFLFPMLYLFLKALRADDTKKKIIYSLIGAIGVIGSILSWGGVNFTFISIGALFILSIILGLSKRNDSIIYLIMVLSIIAVTFITGRYGNPVDIFKGYMFIYFPVALLLNLYTFELYPKIKPYIIKFKPKKVSEHFFNIGSGITLMVLASFIFPGIGFYSYFLSFLIERLENPFGTDAFAMSVSENQSPYFYDPNGHVDWWSPLNFTFFTMLIGSFILFFEMFKGFPKQKLFLTSAYVLTIILFIFSRFSTASEYAAITNFFGQQILGLQLHNIILILFVIYMIYFFVKNINLADNFKTIKLDYLFLFFWFFLTAVGARGGVRIIFAVCPPAMILSGYFFKKCFDWVSKFVESTTLTSVIVYSFVVILVWYNFVVSAASNANFYSSVTSEWEEAMTWVQQSTPLDSAFTHWWDYGYVVQTVGNRATTLDGGNFDVALDHLTGRYLFASRIFQNGTFNMTEPATTLALDFGRPDYFLIIDDDVLKYVQMGRIGKRPTFYTPGYFKEEVENTLNLENSSIYPSLLVFNSYYGAFPLQEEFTYNNFIFKTDWSSVIYNIIFPYNGTISDKPYGVISNQYYPGQYDILPFNCYCIKGEQCYHYRTDGIPECPLIMSDGIVLITEKASDNLFTYLYLLNATVPGFELVYDNERELTVQGMLSSSLTDIKIYKINYEELEPFVADEPLPNYWTATGGTYW